MTTRLPIQTQHCQFCNHLLLATTRSLSALPRRSDSAADKAIILPLEHKNTDRDIEAEPADDDTNSKTTTSKHPTRTKHTTLLLATTIPDRRPTLIRREDGIEKRILLRCGRCRVVIGYHLAQVHYEQSSGKGKSVGHADGYEDEDGEKFPAVYILPGALIETRAISLDVKTDLEGNMGDEGVGGKEWRSWDV